MRFFNKYDLKILSGKSGKRNVGLRRKLALYWILLLLLFLTSLVLIFNVTGVVSTASKKVSETLNIQQSVTYNGLFNHIDEASARTTQMSEKISQDLDQYLRDKQITFSDLNDNRDLINELELHLYSNVDDVLLSGVCSGAFVILDATVNTHLSYSDSSRMSVYLRFTDLNTTRAAKQNIALFRGSPEIAKREGLNLHNRWNMETDTSLIPGYSGFPKNIKGRLSENCLWTNKIKLPNTWENVVMLYSPILDSFGNVYGVCGIEISELYFQLAYKNVSTPYGNMFTVFSPKDGEMMLIGEGLIGYSDTNSVNSIDKLKVNPKRHYNVYESGQFRFVGCERELPVRNINNVPMYLTTMIPYQSYNRYEKKVYADLLYIIILLGILISIMSHFLSKQFTKPIETSIQQLKDGEGEGIVSTGISELDELLAFVSNEKKLSETSEYKLPPRIEELLAKFIERVNTLTPTEHIVLQSYIDGYSIQETAERAFISIHTVRKHNTNINRKLGINSHDELKLYIDILRRSGRLSEIESPASDE